ncbi:poly(A)-binding protein binding protein [Mycoemilia scoparia]|uniref:Poly(A)-binding protein binding protein n=1 Tax=Mycoemilia scoparia TaxID=417184 RepID=A0A9W8DMS3_9FUNG|nr:poly(A)-binding protein binding protein [Mycoemilia scoparia]
MREQDKTEMHNRLLFILTHFMTTSVEVMVKGRYKYTGVLVGANTDNELEIVLNKAIKTSISSASNKYEGTTVVGPVIISAADLIHISAAVDLNSLHQTSEEKRAGFQTDSDISGNAKTNERELHRWVPDADDTGYEMLEDTSLSQTGGSTSWNQFAINEKMFGVKSDFDEELYTTKLNRERPDFRELEKNAIRIANEIQASTTSNPHVAEERQSFMAETPGSDGMDEEDRYGAVIRNAAKTGKYVPPYIRNKAGGAAQGTELQAKSFEDAKNVGSDEKRTDKIAPAPPKAASNAAAAAALSKLNILTIPSGEGHTTPIKDNNKSGTSGAGKSSKTPGGDGPVVKQPARNLAPLTSRVEKLKGDKTGTLKPMPDITSKLIEDREKLQQRRKDMLRGRIDELVKFGSTFKLKTPMPDDVAEIVRAKKAEGDKSDKDIAKITQEDKIPEQSKDKEKEAAAKAGTEKTQDPTNKAPETPLSGETKLSAKAPSFRPNPKAASFVPKPRTTNSRTPSLSSTRVEHNPFFGKRHIIKHTSLLWGDVITETPKQNGTVSPDSVGPTWAFGNKSFRLLLSAAQRDEDPNAHMNSYYMSMPQQYPPQYGFAPGYPPPPPPPQMAQFMPIGHVFNPTSNPGMGGGPWRSGSQDHYSRGFASPVLTATAGDQQTTGSTMVPQHPGLVMMPTMPMPHIPGSQGIETQHQAPTITSQQVYPVQQQPHALPHHHNPHNAYQSQPQAAYITTQPSMQQQPHHPAYSTFPQTSPYSPGSIPPAYGVPFPMQMVMPGHHPPPHQPPAGDMADPRISHHTGGGPSSTSTPTADN